MTTVDWPDIVRTHGPLVWKTAYRLLGNTEDANDCYQETFVAAVRQTRRKVIANWPAFLIHTATRRAIDQIRSKACHRRRQEALAEAPPVDRSGYDPARQAADRETIERLRDALGDLPEQHAVVFTLRYICGWNDQQVAEHVGLKTGNVRVLLHRVRNRLRDRLAAAEQASLKARVAP